MIIAAALCPAPPLLARELTGAEPVVPELRLACLDAAKALVAAGPDLVAVVGVAAPARTWPADGRLDVSAYAPTAPVSERGPTVPLPLGLGARLLDQAGYRGQRELRSVADDEPVESCASLGARLASTPGGVALLVMADGSARRGPKAPGYLDQRSVPFDQAVESAIRAGDMAALLGLDPVLARELMATGRAAWQVLAGALASREVTSQVGYSDDPFGVAYLVASLRPSG